MKRPMPNPNRTAIAAFLLLLAVHPAPAQSRAPGETLHLSFEDRSALLADFVSQNDHYAAQADHGLSERALSIGAGRFGNGLFIEDGAPKSAGTWNQSGLDCDLIVSVVWGEWRKKPHYWGAGHFYGDRGTVAFWVKGEAAHRGVVFMQGSIGWGRKERDLFTVELDGDGRLHAHLRDVNSVYHRVEADASTWTDGEWHHVAVSYDRAYGMKLYHNGALVGSTWGEDGWWQAPLPGLFSPFLQESRYDEIRMFDYPLDEGEVAALYERNEAPAAPVHRETTLEPDAVQRLLAQYGDLDQVELPVLMAGEGTLRLRQSLVESCTDEKIPVDFVRDGRYELAWPTPYRLFTFVLGDADFHGEDIHVKLAPGEKPNYIAFEGALTGLAVHHSPTLTEQLKAENTRNQGDRTGSPTGDPILALDDYRSMFYSQAIDLEGAESFHIPLVKEHGLPEELEGSVKMPLTGDTRIHEIHLWEATWVPATRARVPEEIHIQGPIQRAELKRYGPALEKLTGSRDATVLAGGDATAGVSEHVARPLHAFHLVTPVMEHPTTLGGLGVRLLVKPDAPSDVLWVKLRDPGNPSRIWSQAVVRVEYGTTEAAKVINLEMDVIDLLLGPGDRLLVELTFAHGGTVVLGDGEAPTALTLLPASDEDAAHVEYAQHALLPARMQYMKEYNYRPWLFTGNTITVDDWAVFGGPYDMAYPPLAVLRQDPGNERANYYKTLLFERPWFGSIEPDEPERPLRFKPVAGAPAWATAQRELLHLNWDVVDWIVGQQRHDGMFWGGANDDSFIPLGWAALPFLGHAGARDAWLRFYEGLEELGIYHDGYCDIWPIDPLHITDFICSRGLMLAYDPGNPQVFERELRTAERYAARVNAANAERAKQGLPPLTGDRAMRDDPQTDLIDQMDSEIAHYSRTHVGWWWGETAPRPPHVITDPDAVAAQMLDAVRKTDDTAVFGFTEARVHTDNQRGIGRDVLINTALGGRVQGYTEPFPPSIAVSWENADTPDFTRLVRYADESRLVVNCYNFEAQPRDVTLRVYRLQPGTYALAAGTDADDDGVIDSVPDTEEMLALERFSTVLVTLPPGQNTTIVIALQEAVDRPEQLPDLAISPKDVVVHEGYVEVTVHNLGAVAVEKVHVVLTDDEGRILAEESIAHLGSPRDDLAAKRATVRLKVKDNSKGAQVIADPGQRVDEVFRENNWVVLTRGAR